MNKARGLLGMKRVVTIAILLAMTVLVMAAATLTSCCTKDY
jgi:hypothetical protein